MKDKEVKEEEKEKAVVPEEFECTECGAAVSEDAEKCPSCGEAFDED
jgi:rubrerythrin